MWTLKPAGHPSRSAARATADGDARRRARADARDAAVVARAARDGAEERRRRRRAVVERRARARETSRMGRRARRRERRRRRRARRVRDAAVDLPTAGVHELVSAGAGVRGDGARAAGRARAGTGGAERGADREQFRTLAGAEVGQPEAVLRSVRRVGVGGVRVLVGDDDGVGVRARVVVRHAVRWARRSRRTRRRFIESCARGAL